MLQGKPAGESDSVTMDAIKDILDDNEDAFEAVRRDVESRGPRKPKQTFIEPVATTQPVKTIEERVAMAKFTTVPPGEASSDPIPTAQPVADQATSDDTDTRFTPLAPARGTPKPATINAPALFAALHKALTWNRVCFFAILGLALFRPGLVILTIVLTLGAIVGAFLFLGADRIWDAVAHLLTRVTKRSPARGEQMRKWLDTVAYRWDGVLDRFPEGSVDVLYMPDFSYLAQQQQRDDAVVSDRLDRMHSQV